MVIYTYIYIYIYIYRVSPLDAAVTPCNVSVILGILGELDCSFGIVAPTHSARLFTGTKDAC